MKHQRYDHENKRLERKADCVVTFKEQGMQQTVYVGRGIE